MTEINQKIIDMIEKSASANEICEATGLSNRQLYYRQNMMKSKGYIFSKKFFYNGDIVYKLNKGLVTEKNHEIALFTSKKDNQFRAVFISDLHLSNKCDRVDLLNAVYNFLICYQYLPLPFCKKKRALREAWRIYQTEFYIAFHQCNLFCRQAQANSLFHLLP